MKEKESKTPLTKEEKRKELWRTIKFVLFSISAGIIQMGSLLIMEQIPHYVFNTDEYSWVPLSISLVLSVIWNFTFNRKFTFQSAENVPIAMLKTFAYYVVFGPLSIWLGHMYLVLALHWNVILVEGVLMVINFITEFLYQRFYVFRKTIDTNDIAMKQKEREEQKKD